MNKQSVNTFMKGMNKDSDKSVQPKDSYLDALNFRIVTSEGASTGAFENVKGNHLLAGFYGLPEGMYICGSVRVRDYIVIFMTTNTGTPVHGVGRNVILKIYINSTTEDLNGPIWVLYDDNENAGTGNDTLDFSTAYPIKAIARYETTTIQKVYFTDGINHLRYMDVGKNLTITGNVHSGNNYMATSMFEFLPEFISSRPVLADIVGGELMTGMVQYAYQLYRLNGAETAFSPVSDMIHLVADNDFANNTLSYGGSPESVNSGKGCKLTIVNSNNGYNRLRLVRIHYSTLNSIPVITICNEIEISTTASTVTVTDTGGIVSSLTLDEFNISSTELFSCEDIASKDNRLFAANINKSDFKSNDSIENWDARAVRFRAVDNTAYVFDAEGGNVLIDNTFSTWANYTATHDGINRFNDDDNYDNTNYWFKYQADSATVGAEGPNIKIDIESELVSIDTSNTDTTFYSTTPTDSSDLSYKNYSSPWKDGKLSWQRDETYRLFVVFGNDRGQTSDPKWICDFRMPSLHEDFIDNDGGVGAWPHMLSVESANVPFTGEILTHRLYPRVKFKSFPTDAAWAQIYRVKRDRSDRSIVTQGLVIPSEFTNDHYHPTYASASNLDSGEIIKLVSPEINITKNISRQANDYLEYVTYFSHINYTESADGLVNRVTHKLIENTRVEYNADNRTDINDAIVISPLADTNGWSIIDDKAYINYKDTTTNSKGSTGLLISYDNEDWSPEGQEYAIANYKSNIFGSQYGGNTYESRMLNISIPCSDIILPTQVDTYVDIPYGDTFISYFDVSTLLYDLSKTYWIESTSEVVYVPLESSINCNLRHDTSSQHETYSNPLSALRQEYAGTHVFENSHDNMTFTYIQDKDLYLYNTVYSQQTSAQYAMSTMLDISSETVFDCLVKASNIKYNGENSDSWTKFNVNEEIEVDANYGEILAINTVNDKLLYWQEDAFGVLSVNVRSLIQDSSSAQLALGTGGILDRYDYISSTVGIDNKRSIVLSDQAVYWFYDKDTSLYQFSNKLSNITKDKGLWSWFNNNYYYNYIVHGIYDRLYNEVLYTIYEPDGTGNTVGFSEQTGAFEPRRSFVPRMYIDAKEYYFSVVESADPDTSLIYFHNSDIQPRCEFYGTQYPSTITLLYNEDYPYTKVFDNIYYISNAFDEANGVEQYGITFDRMRCYNDYQNSDWVTLTYPTNIMRRDRGWTVVVPRNLVDHDYTTSPDIFTDLDTGGATKTWKERIRDKYMVLDLSFDNTSETRFVVPFIGVKYRLSYR
jgi:hypothetical protein